MKRKLLIEFIIFSFLIIGFQKLRSCKPLEKSMLVSTGEVNSITTNSAEAVGVVIDIGDGASQRGHCFEKNPNPSIDGQKTELGAPTGPGGFTSRLTNLEAGTKYYIKAYIRNADETVYGKEISFTTTAASIPAIATTVLTAITTTTATGGGNITSDGGSPITGRGVCWNTISGPTIVNTKTTEGTGTGSFSSSLTNLTPGTTYYVRAYATNGVGTAYGDELSFTTISLTSIPPTLTTTAYSALASTTVKSGGNITSDGGASVTARGVCWSISANPTIANSKTLDGTGSGIFGSSVTGLTANTVYYLRAYATNSAGTAYGNEISFNTTIQLADFDGNIYNTVKIGTQLWMKENLKVMHYRNGDAISEVTNNTAWNALTSGAFCYYNNDFGNVSIYGRIYNYYTTIDNRNLCPTGWHVPTSAEWTVLRTYLGGENVAGGKLKETGTTNWISPNTGATNESGFTALPGGIREIDGLFNDIGKNSFWWSSTEWDATNSFLCQTLYDTPDAIYYFNSKKLGLSVRCLQGEGKVLPAVITTAISGITSTAALSGGNVTSDGGVTINAKGVCWSTSSGPTTALTTKTSDGTGVGSFVSNLAGLTIGATYFVRAYATNSVGTAYGNEISFTTINCMMCKQVTYENAIIINQSADTQYCGPDLQIILNTPPVVVGGLTTKYECHVK